VAREEDRLAREEYAAAELEARVEYRELQVDEALQVVEEWWIAPQDTGRVGGIKGKRDAVKETPEWTFEPQV
jgi:hypothetical protein